MTRYIKLISIILVTLVVSMAGFIFFIPTTPLLADKSFSRVVYAKQGQLLRLTLSQDGKYRAYTPLRDVSTSLIQATLLEEDQYFYQHPGINPLAMIKAAWQTYVSGTRRLGASTLTMQVARLQYQIHSKTLWGKLHQLFRALQLEARYNKQQILEAYFNLAPYGNNIEGVGAASLIYFNKPAAQLNLPEALTLAVIPQHPSQRTPDKTSLAHVRNKLFHRWLHTHPNDQHLTALIQLPLQMRPINKVPFIAPHFVNEVLAHTPANQLTLHTTLNLTLQTAITQLTKNYLARKAALGVHNSAVLAIDTRDMSVNALLGSANYFNAAISGQINGTNIKRSPGSTLKPFIYALALDQGIIHPGTVLKDVPRSFGSYNPENFDYDFLGPISAKDALVLSRNIPAVYLADQLNQPSLYDFLQAAHIQRLKAESYYGLALVLGGAELTMQELSGLYATLANDGLWQPLRFLQTENRSEPKRLLSAEASFLVLDMLQSSELPGTHYGVTNQAAMPIAWKTGTSSGFRDAWTVGVIGPYVVAVWIGNFNNQSNPAFIGKEITAPLFFAITHTLQSQHLLPNTPKRRAPLKLTKVDVCKASGLLPTRYCTDTESVWFIPGKSPITADTIFREVAIDDRTGLRTCHYDKHTAFEIYEFWPSDLLKIYKLAGIQRKIPPAYTAECDLNAKKSSGFAPQILSPEKNIHYVTRQLDKQTSLPFSAMVDADVRHVYWFINSTYLGESTRDQTFMWQAKPGHYVVRAVDEFGRSDARDLTVELASN